MIVNESWNQINKRETKDGTNRGSNAQLLTQVWTKCYDYCLLSVDDLSHVIQSDELHVSDEVAGTFRAVTHWVEADIDHRLLHLANLLLHVRFGLSRRRCDFFF